MPDHKGETRRQRNARFDVETPDAPETEGGEFLWETYTSLSRFRAMGMNGPDPITPRDIRDWCEMTGTVLRREECGILIEMDAAYRNAWQVETEANAERQKEEQAPPQPAPQRRRR